MDLANYKTAMQKELEAILSFWIQHTVDEKYGGFVGQINSQHEIVQEAPKGSVLNARILWSFSAAYHLTGNQQYLDHASRAFEYINTHFIDRENGGVYWTVDYKGNPLDTKKQIYALAFTIYAFSEFYKATKNPKAIQEAIELFDTIIHHSFDNINGGYIEAFTKDWQEIKDLRLSDKDANERKTMNTHLHILEAFTVLYKVNGSQPVKQKIAALIQNFLDHIVDSESNHLHLFLDENWEPKSTALSYGHDIEAAWLLQEAAVAIEEKAVIEKVKKISVQMTNAVMQGLDSDGGLWYEYEPATSHLVKEKHMWPQAEAMVGFFNAWQNTDDKMYLEKSISTWHFVQQHIQDKQRGEWFWGVKENYEPMQEDKVGLWKCPYHNSRACIEIIQRINQIQHNKS